MLAPLQVTVADQEGLDVQQLARLIEENYRRPDGRAVRVTIGQLTEAGFLIVEERP